MKNTKYHGQNSPKSSRTDRDNIKTSNTNIHDPSLSWLDTDRRRHCIARCMGMQNVPSKEIYTMADIA
jgi:hypothetical protein